VVVSDTEGEASEDAQFDDLEASGSGVGTPMLPPRHHHPDAFETDSGAPRDPAP
jgi:hypothetical protein